ncbi:MAG TPA: hypothetical protein VEW04_06095, partial [Allosphingosinicella sp.]|nr:hypothetical protein [Allosphingosinicella sp.]
RLGVGGLVDESLRSRRFGPVRGLADLGPLMALLAERYPGIERTPRRAAVDRFVDYRLSLIIRAAAKAGDLAALRAIPGIPPRPPGAADRLILAVADLPPPLARAIYDLGFRAKALFRRLKRRLGAPPSDRFDPLLARHTDYRPDGGRISLLGASHLQG